MTPSAKLRLGMLIESARSILRERSLDEELLAFMRQEDVEIAFLALHSSLARLREAIELTQTCLEVGLHQLAPYWNDYPSGEFDPHGEGNNPHVWHDVTGREWTEEDSRRSSLPPTSTRWRKPMVASTAFVVTNYMAGRLFQPNVRLKDPDTGKFVDASKGVLFTGDDGEVSQDNANFFWDASNTRLGIGTESPGATVDPRTLREKLYVVDAQCTCGIFRSAWIDHCLNAEHAALGMTVLDGLINRDVQ